MGWKYFDHEKPHQAYPGLVPIGFTTARVVLIFVSEIHGEPHVMPVVARWEWPDDQPPGWIVEGMQESHANVTFADRGIAAGKVIEEDYAGIKSDPTLQDALSVVNAKLREEYAGKRGLTVKEAMEASAKRRASREQN